MSGTCLKNNFMFVISFFPFTYVIPFSIYVSDIFFTHANFHPLPLRQVQLFPQKKWAQGELHPTVFDSKHQNRTIKVHAFASCKTQQVELNQSTELVGGWATL